MDYSTGHAWPTRLHSVMDLACDFRLNLALSCCCLAFDSKQCESGSRMAIRMIL